MPRIKEMYAFITYGNSPEDESVVAFKEGNTWMPMVGADMDRVNSLKPMAKMLTKQLKQPIKLIHFTAREDLETIL